WPAVSRHATVPRFAAALSRFPAALSRFTATLPRFTALPRFATQPWRFHAVAKRAGAAFSRYADPSRRSARAVSGNAGASGELADGRRLAHAVSDAARSEEHTSE